MLIILKSHMHSSGYSIAASCFVNLSAIVVLLEFIMKANLEMRFDKFTGLPQMILTEVIYTLQTITRRTEKVTILCF